MSDNKSTPSTGIDWQDIQAKYLEACRMFSQFIPIQGVASQFRNPLTDTMEHWWQSIAPYVPADKREFVDKILGQSKIYYFLGEQITRILNETNKAADAGRDWERIFNKQFDDIKIAYGKMQDDAKEAAHKMMGAWQLLPLDTLQRTFSLGSAMPGDFLGPLKHDDIQKMSDKFLSIPGVGYTRESQEQAQEGIRLWGEYQKVSQEFNQALYKVGMDSLEVMRQKILAMAREGKEIKSLREIYDLWIDCNEETYASFVYTPEYSRLYGRLTNALMAVKQHGRNIVDESLGALNVPTYKGINTLQKRQYDMGKQQKEALKKIKELQQEITELHVLLKQSGAKDTRTPSVRAVKPVPGNASVIAISDKRKERAKKSVPRKKKRKVAGKGKMIVIKI